MMLHHHEADVTGQAGPITDGQALSGTRDVLTQAGKKLTDGEEARQIVSGSVQCTASSRAFRGQHRAVGFTTRYRGPVRGHRQSMQKGAKQMIATAAW
jgi:hypothetical protein